MADLFPTGRFTTDEQPASVTSQTKASDDDYEGPDAALAKLHRVMSKLKPQQAISEEDAADLDQDVHRPGSFYERYRKVPDLSNNARPFYEAAAEMVGVDLRMLVRAVMQTELKLGKWQEDQRRMELHGELAPDVLMGDDLGIESEEQ